MKPEINRITNQPATHNRLAPRGNHHLAQARRAVAEQFQNELPDKHLLHLVLNEAEALAWQTGVPHLVFPALALEKVHALAEWQARQEAIRRRNELAFAA
ncbi:MAG: hypothetical protein AB1705_05265 [Verrucomicrobiota bacterium]